MFSIIVPVYNKAQFVRACLASIMAQSYRDFEAIVVNDGSTDTSEMVILDVIKDDPRFRYEMRENGGVSGARNAGAQLATRPWLAFIDADDIWEEEFLAEMKLAIIKHPNVDLVSCAYASHIGSGRKAHYFGFSEKYTHDYDFYSHALDFHPPIWTSATTVRKSVFLDIGGFVEEISSGEDIMLWVKFIHSRHYLFVNRVLAIYVQCDANSLTRCRSPKVVQSRQSVLNFLRAQMRIGNVPRRYFNVMCQIHFNEFLESGQSALLLAFWVKHGPNIRLRDWLHGTLQLCGLRVLFMRGLSWFRNVRNGA